MKSLPIEFHVEKCYLSTHMKHLVLTFLVVLFSFKTLASESPKLVIFTVHGFISNESAFCDLKAILKDDYGDQVKVHDLVYYDYLAAKNGLTNEGSLDNGDIRTFTKIFYKKIMEYYRDNNLDINTPFALVTHSQGGIIGMRYVADCIYGKEFYCSGRRNGVSITPKNLKYFITLATPFWGSTAANRLKILDFIGKLAPVKQVGDLSMGSSIITYNREMSLEPFLQKNENIFPPQTEVITVSADISKSALGTLFNIFTDSGKNNLVEHDLVVPMFSANIDYHFKVYPEDRDGYSVVGRTNMGHYYYPIPGFHAEYGFIEGLACVKRLRDEDRHYKDNTVYLIIRKHLDQFVTPLNTAATEKLLEPSRFVTDLQTFNMEVKLNLPQKDAWFRKIYFQKKHVTAFSDDPLIVDASRRDSILFHRFRGFNYDHSSSDLNYVTYYHTAFFERGFFNLSLGESFYTKDVNPYSAEFGLDIQIPWFKPVRITAPVSPANTTFVEYNLEPIDRKILAVKVNDTTNRETIDGNQIIALQSTLLSTRMIQFNRKDDRGTVEIVHLPKDNWLKVIPAKDPQGIDTIYNECYDGTFSSKRRGKDNYYLGFYDNEPQRINKVKEPQPVSLERFQILGRYAEGAYDAEDQTYERDRLLVTNASLKRRDRKVSLNDIKPDQYLRTGYYWVDTKYARLIESCSTTDSLRE